MMNRHIPGAVRNVGKIQGFLGISVLYGVERVIVNDVGHDCRTVETSWEFTPDELDRLARGGSLRIKLVAAQWPPALFYVTEPEKEELIR
jgi:hypothetical protein